MSKNVFELRIVAHFDPPLILDASVTPIPASSASPLQVISALQNRIYQVCVRDGIQTEFIGLYRGKAGSEVLACIIGGPGETRIEAIFDKGDRVSLRAMDNAAIVSGNLCVQFLGL